ncbi:hypothetical protein BDR22DRAFT_349101 [Usnea florida]
MVSPSSSPLTAIWRKWKTLELPWRKRWLAGTDLNGNTFWYFKPSLAFTRPRRILENNPKIPYSDIEISPSWHQWLRGTRSTPPSLPEQIQDVQRQRELKRLVAAADARWAAKPSVLDRRTGSGETVEKEKSEGEKRERGERLRKEKENPWARQRGSAGEGWQPEAWSPGPVK